MSDTRLASAMARIEAALRRIAKARALIEAQAKEQDEAHLKALEQAKAAEGAGSAKVMALVNRHEKLREEVADTMRELDLLIEELES